MRRTAIPFQFHEGPADTLSREGPAARKDTDIKFHVDCVPVIIQHRLLFVAFRPQEFPNLEIQTEQTDEHE